MDSLIELRSVCKDYYIGDQKVQVLKSINFNVNKGDFIAVTGTSGSGKSTLLNIIGCLDRVSSGSYVLDGVEVQHLNPVERAKVRNRSIGFIFQNFNLIPEYSALKNVALPLVYAGYNYRDQVRMSLQALEKVSLSHRVKHKPNQLSGGERQRIAIARALVNKPALLLADEPTGNLDSNTSLDVLDLIVQLNQAGNTVIFVTHDHGIGKHAHKNCRIRNGEVEFF